MTDFNALIQAKAAAEATLKTKLDAANTSYKAFTDAHTAWGFVTTNDPRMRGRNPLTFIGDANASIGSLPDLNALAQIHRAALIEFNNASKAFNDAESALEKAQATPAPSP